MSVREDDEVSVSNGADAEGAQQDATAASTGADEGPAVDFAELGIGARVQATLREMGFERPTEVQARTVPLAYAGHDLVVQSRTGSGKTAAFGIPLIDRLIDPTRREVQALVLAPTRELALQVARECGRIAGQSAIEVVPIYGGAPMVPQVRQLEAGAQVVVGTPGRVLDHIRRKTLDPSPLKVLVLDEGDEMLSMGFQEEINNIIETLPAARQTLLFSATVPAEIERLIQRYLRDPVRLSLSQDFVGVREIDHGYYLLSGSGRLTDLLQVIDHEDPQCALVFCNTREDTTRVAEFLAGRGYTAQAISSDLSQRERMHVMQLMHDGKLRFLVATDVAARGIDIADITHVINYTFPESPDVYVHRTGRTGRAGKSGRAVSLVSAKEIGSLYYLKLVHKIVPQERRLPSPEEATARREAETLAELSERLAHEPLDPRMVSLLRRIWSTPEAEPLLARALGLALKMIGSEGPGESVERFAANDPAIMTSADALEDEERRRRRFRPTEVGHRRGSPNSSSAARERRDTKGDPPRRRRRSSRDTLAEAPAVAGPAPSERSEEDLESYTTADGDVEYFETLSATPVGAQGVAPTARLYVNLGRRHQVASDDLLAFVRSEAGADLGQPRLELYDRHSYLVLAEELSQQVIDRLSGKRFKGRTLRVEPARPPSAS